MKNNRVRDIRTAKGLTQRQLAQIVGTSQQQIQRIEAGRQSVRFDLATRIAYALDASLAQVFADTAVPLRRLRRRHAEPTWADAVSDSQTREGLEHAGLDLEPEIWFLKCRLRGGTEHAFRVSGTEKARLWSAVQRLGDHRFVVFESVNQSVVLNLDHLIYAHFLFEPPNRIAEDTASEEDDGGVSVLFAGESDFCYFDVDADEPEPDDDATEDSGQFRNLLFEAELSSELNDVLHFMDVDGETAFIRANDVALIRVALWVIYPELDVDEEDSEP